MSKGFTQQDTFQEDEDYLQFNSEAFLRDLLSDNEVSDKVDGESSMGHRRVQECRPRLTNSSMLKGLVERTEHYNKNVDRKVMTEARMAFEEEQLRGTTGGEMEVLAASNQHIPTRGRGDSFGRMRSVTRDEGIPPVRPPSNNSSHYNNNYTNNTILPTNRNFNFEEAVSQGYQLPQRSAPRMDTSQNDQPPRHVFNPATAYNGKVTPIYRFNYNPNGPQISAPGAPTPHSFIRPGQRYPKRPDNNPQQPSVPKHLNHNYYQINLYGSTQDERIAQRIEKTVRQTEQPPQRF